GIDNISLVRNTTTISVRSTKNPQPSVITHDAAASVNFDTDFGSLLTNGTPTDITYRITNTGSSRPLNINSIQITPNNVGFSILGAVPTTIAVGQNATFTVRFAPTEQGIRTADVAIIGNIVPNNPFRFEVKGSGKSCNLTPVPIAQYGFEGAAPEIMPIAAVQGNIKVVGGTAVAPNPSFGAGSRLYPAGNLFASSSPSTAWYIRVSATNVSTLEFGAVDLTNQQEVSVNCDLAAFALSLSGFGVISSDYILLTIYNPPIKAWSKEIRLTGSSN